MRSGTMSGYSITASRGEDLCPGVVPAKAGTHIPEAAVYGTMGPRLRGDDMAAQ